MKSEQDASGTPPIEPSEQPMPATQSVLSAQSRKPEKNLYEPYVTPRLVYELFRWFAILVFSVTTRIRLRGHYNVPKHGPFLIVANHLAWTDIPLVPMYLPGKVVYMAKEEYFSSRIAWLVRLLGAFPVKRGEGDRQALRAAEQQLKKGNVVVLFPEGTRSRTRTMAKAHAGIGMIALRTGVPVVPVAIWGSEHALKKFGARVTISYGTPMVFKPKGTKLTREEIDNATEEATRAIAALLPPEYRGVYAV